MYSFECLPSLKKTASMGLDLAMYCIVSRPKNVKITTKDIAIDIIPGINPLNVFYPTSYGAIVNISNLSNMIIARIWFIPLRRGVSKQDVWKECHCIWSCQQWFIIYKKILLQKLLSFVQALKDILNFFCCSILWQV